MFCIDIFSAIVVGVLSLLYLLWLYKNTDEEK